MPTILLTGFGPFPGAPSNPTAPLIERLARRRRPGVTIVPHVFATSYAAVDRDLPLLLLRHKPDALLMFGLAQKTPHLRIETRARNVLSERADVTGKVASARVIAPGRMLKRPLPTPHRTLLAAARSAGVPAAISANAGDYLCNYLCWRAIEAAKKHGRPRLAAFVHVPQVNSGRRAADRLDLADLARAGTALLAAVVAAAARR